MVVNVGRGRPPRGKLKSFKDWKNQQGSGRPKTKEAYEGYKARYATVRGARLQEREAAATAEAIAAVEAAKAAEQPLLDKRDWAKLQPPGADTSRDAYAQYEASWNEARAAQTARAAAAASDEEEEKEKDDDEEEAPAAAAAAAAAATKVRREEAAKRWGFLLGAHKKKEAAPSAPALTGSAASAAASGSGPASSSPSSSAEAAAAHALVGLGQAMHNPAVRARRPSTVPRAVVVAAAQEFKAGQQQGRVMSVVKMAEKHGVPLTSLRRYINKADPGKAKPSRVI